MSWNYVNLFVLTCCLSFSFLSHSQELKKVEYTIETVEFPSVLSAYKPAIEATEFKLFKLDIATLRENLEGVTYREGEVNGFIGEMKLPHVDGTTRTYTVKRNQTMHPDLQEKFPSIRTYDAYAKDGSGAFCKWDITPTGLHAMIFIPGESTIFIDPYSKENSDVYIVYRKKDFRTDKSFSCLFESEEISESKDVASGTNKAMFGTCELRTYRLAVAATGEYTTFHGGTVTLALAAQVTTMNRVNGVYEKDIAITMVIIPNNDLLIYTNTATDPYTNGTPGTMINQNQTNITTVIGSANYDIGHVFGTNSGGLAGLGVVCTSSQKARGVTGSSAPIGDPFDIDYVAHEMGHQFGANHTQNNNCNSVAAARHEPGSASTIMGYAGICAPNIQNNSDDYFHGYSLGEISTEILSNGHQCEVITALNNSAPTIVSTNANISIPINTPFALSAVATDVDNDVLTYLWEQMNNQASTQPPVASATGGPNFRSFDPSLDSTRYFPNLQTLASNGPSTWEVLPSVSRTMNFRLTVRDNHAVGSCNDYVNVTVATVASAGPFVVSYPSATGITWASTSNQLVTWDVANTTAAPVNCDSVRILLSIDGGLTYPYVLSNATPNDGTQQILVPNVNSTTARVMVQSKTGTFFDISNNNFTITSCAPPDLATVSAVQPTCFGDATQLSVVAGNLNDAQQWSWYAGTCFGTAVGTGSSISLTPTQTTTYFVTGTGACTGSTCAEVTVVVPPALTNQVVQSGVQLTAQQTNASYQWLDCQNGNANIPGATQQSFVPTANTGSYAVQISVENCTVTSPCFFIDQTGIDAVESSSILVFPNPFSDGFTVKWEKEQVESMELLDATGKLVHVAFIQHAEEYFLPTNTLNYGVYFLRVRTGSATLFTKLIKQ